MIQDVYSSVNVYTRVAARDVRRLGAATADVTNTGSAWERHLKLVVVGITGGGGVLIVESIISQHLLHIRPNTLTLTLHANLH